MAITMRIPGRMLLLAAALLLVLATVLLIADARTGGGTGLAHAAAHAHMLHTHLVMHVHGLPGQSRVLADGMYHHT